MDGGRNDSKHARPTFVPMPVVRRRALQRGRSSIPFLILQACAAVFIGVTSRSLPAIVASHFNVAGVANGLMTRALYVPFSLAFAVVLPLLLVFVSGRALNNPSVCINLPNREYWFAPERRAEAVNFMCLHLARFASMLTFEQRWIPARQQGKETA